MAAPGGPSSRAAAGTAGATAASNKHGADLLPPTLHIHTTTDIIMAHPRGRGRADHAQPPPQPSDYETDAPPPAVDVPLPPPRSNEELNFSVLKRLYPKLHAIEHVTPYAALYTFKLETESWEKVGIEGTLFICQLAPSRTGVETYCVIIHNRRGLDNFYLDLTSSEEMEISDPYVILQGDEVVYGIWIFADPPPASTANCRTETGNKMMEIADRARVSREAREGEDKNGLKLAAEEEEVATSTPMGRQLSLRELFGQRREQDAGFSMHNHTSQLGPTAYPQQAYLGQNAAPAQQDVLGSDEIGSAVRRSAGKKSGKMGRAKAGSSPTSEQERVQIHELASDQQRGEQHSRSNGISATRRAFCNI